MHCPLTCSGPSVRPLVMCLVSSTTPLYRSSRRSRRGPVVPTYRWCTLKARELTAGTVDDWLQTAGPYGQDILDIAAKYIP